MNEHLEAIDYDLLTLRLDIRDVGTADLPWVRLRGIVTYLPETSALARSIHGEHALWDADTHLLAAAVDALNAANWQRGGGKGRRPKPVPRPGEAPKDQRRFGTGRMTIDEAQAFFDRVNRAPANPVHAAPVVASCSEDGCGRRVHARGWCTKHYQRWWRANRR